MDTDYGDMEGSDMEEVPGRYVPSRGLNRPRKCPDNYPAELPQATVSLR